MLPTRSNAAIADKREAKVGTAAQARLRRLSSTSCTSIAAMTRFGKNGAKVTADEFLRLYAVRSDIVHGRAYDRPAGRPNLDDLAEAVILRRDGATSFLYFIYFRRDSLGRWLIEEM